MAGGTCKCNLSPLGFFALSCLATPRLFWHIGVHRWCGLSENRIILWWCHGLFTSRSGTGEAWAVLSSVATTKIANIWVGQKINLFSFHINRDHLNLCSFVVGTTAIIFWHSQHIWTWNFTPEKHTKIPLKSEIYIKILHVHCPWYPQISGITVINLRSHGCHCRR